VADPPKRRQGLPRKPSVTPPPTAAAPSGSPPKPAPTDAASAATPAPAPRQGLPRKSAATGSESGAASAEASPAPARRGLPRSPTAAAPASPEPVVADSGEAASGARESRARRAALICLAGLGAAVVLVLIARWFVDLGFMRDFIADHPGEYALPADAPVGLPVWLDWAHFFNAFLMVLIVRTGLQFRREVRPPAFWAPKGNGDGKISLTLWLHQALDLLWVVLGVAFFVLLFTTGQWMRVVPTSWAVFPNAVSVALQYVSLHWPSENGWVAYNSLQQLAYFVTVFIAAPLAIVSGARLSGLWPKGATRLNRIYPMALARKLHFPVMLYFVAFIVVHVTLVFVTEPLRNLDHMFAGRGSIDPGAYMTDWTGAAFFAAAVAVTVGALVALSKPRFVAPVAGWFGKVSSR